MADQSTLYGKHVGVLRRPDRVEKHFSNWDIKLDTRSGMVEMEPIPQ